ncbi:class I SAM-dependent methyltransferase [Candidatus Hydrogenedentota bacterium]
MKRSPLAPFWRLRDLLIQLRSVRDVAEYQKISVIEAVKRARIKETPEEEKLWNEFDRQAKIDYRDYYARNPHYIERHDWTNRAPNLSFLKHIPQSGAFLDYGCGTAYVAFRAKQKRCDISLHLADIPEAMTKDYAQWRLRKHNLSFAWHDIPLDEQIDFGAKFDFIRCHDVLEHTFHPDAVVGNFLASLKTGGILSFDFLVDSEFDKENTRESQALRERTLEIALAGTEVLEQHDNYYLVRKVSLDTRQ